MNRHRFLKTCSGLGAAFVIGSAWINPLSQIWKPRILLYSTLPENIKLLRQLYFGAALPESSLSDILSELTRRGVYKNGVFDIHQIRLNAKDDALVEFDNFLYTESELLLYAMIARLAMIQVGVILVPTGVSTGE